MKYYSRFHKVYNKLTLSKASAVYALKLTGAGSTTTTFTADSEVTQEIGMAHSITIQLVFLFPGNNQETEPRIKEDIKFCFVDVVQIPTPLFVENFAI